jgi:hypothetical protein
MTGQGANSVCIGLNAGKTSTPANTIVINASGIELSPATAGLFINPIASATATANASGSPYKSLQYNSTTSELSYYNYNQRDISTWNCTSNTSILSGGKIPFNVTSGLNILSQTITVSPGFEWSPKVLAPYQMTFCYTGTGTGIITFLKDNVQISNYSLVPNQTSSGSFIFLPSALTSKYTFKVSVASTSSSTITSWVTYLQL